MTVMGRSQWPPRPKRTQRVVTTVLLISDSVVTDAELTALLERVKETKIEDAIASGLLRVVKVTNVTRVESSGGLDRKL